ncbi:hypothetical protein MRB53_025083 [Persea americana]|uniref:Uncharacterized protein n=1 Tax=Persea americana TaxID=3435 RepID=A0ACC2LER6_PERAE|nr:hypothetical protein MRB53_025083 [Persea americana]
MRTRERSGKRWVVSRAHLLVGMSGAHCIVDDDGGSSQDLGFFGFKDRTSIAFLNFTPPVLSKQNQRISERLGDFGTIWTIEYSSNRGFF